MCEKANECFGTTVNAKGARRIPKLKMLLAMLVRSGIHRVNTFLCQPKALYSETIEIEWRMQVNLVAGGVWCAQFRSQQSER